MTKRVECPICEAVQEVLLEGTPQTCTRCGQEFDPASCLEVTESTPSPLAPPLAMGSSTTRPDSGSNDPADGSTPPNEISVSPARGTEDESQIVPLPLPPSPIVEATSDVVSDGLPVALTREHLRSVDAHLKHLKHQKRRRMKVWFLLATCVMALGITGLVYWMIMYGQTRGSAEPLAANPSEPADPLQRFFNEPGSEDAGVAKTDPAGSGQTETAENTPSSETPAPEQKPALPLEPISFSPFRFLNTSTAERVWTKAYLSIFELKIKRGDQLTVALGTLIDSRGWVVTSWSAIAGAESIQVRNAASNPKQDIPTSALADLSAGLLASAPEQDLAIIQINRRLVTVINPLTSVERLPVEGTPGLATHWPGTQPATPRFAWLQETRTENGESWSAIPTDLQRAADQAGLSQTENWLVQSFAVLPTPGAAILNDEGHVVGICTAATHDRLALVAPFPSVLALQGQIAKDPIPFQRNPSASNDSPLPPAAILPESFDGPEVPSGRKGHAISRKLNEQAWVCNEFGWVPTTDREYAQFLDFLETAQTVLANVEAADLPFSDLDRLDEQLDYWNARIAQTLDNPLKDSVAVLHKTCLERMQLESDVRSVVAAEVIQQATLGGKSVYLRITGTDQFLIIPVDPDRFVMPPQSRWLLVLNRIRENPKVVTLSARSELETISARDAQVVYAIRLDGR